MLPGSVFDIARFSLADGPGVRTAVFLKGCPLRCAWCHNPESQQPFPELLFAPEKCIGCGRCAEVCPRHCHDFTPAGRNFDRSGCSGCGVCVSRCHTGALELAGKAMTPEAVMAEVARDADYYGDLGGITLTGGEPLFQPEFSLALLEKARAMRISTAVETCGYADRSVVARMAKLVDYWLYDLKLADAREHRKFTGVDNSLIIANLHYILAMNAKVELRLPIIPGVNDGETALAAMRKLIADLPAQVTVHLEPCHPFGNDKLRRLGRSGITFEIPPEATLGRCRERLACKNVAAFV